MNDNCSHKKIAPVDVAKALGIGVQAVRIGLQRGHFPFGGAIKTSDNRHVYFVYPKLYEEYLKGAEYEKVSSKQNIGC